MEATKTRKRQKLTQGERATMQNEALDRAEHGRTCGNDLLILTAFASRGIDAHPRVDCFTFNAWRALNRHVKKGEHGVHVPVYAHVEDIDQETGTKTEHTIPTGATVFHISQTDPDEPRTPAAIEADTLDNIEATQRQDTDADEREQAEDDHEAALLEDEQNDDAFDQETARLAASPAIVIVDPLTGAVLRRVPIAEVATKDTRPEVSRTSGSNDLSLF